MKTKNSILIMIALLQVGLAMFVSNNHEEPVLVDDFVEENQKTFDTAESESSPIKDIILTHFLDKNLITRAGRWKDSYEQLIHIEPLANGKICAVVMSTVKNRSGKYDVTVNLKFKDEEVAKNYFIDPDETKSKFIRKANGEYDWDLVIHIRDDREDENVYHIFENVELERGEFVDLNITPDDIFSLGFNLVENKSRKLNRICRIGLH